MKGQLNSATGILFAAIIFAVGPDASADSNVTSRLEALQVSIDATGKESFAPAAQVKPGDLIEYRLVYDNTGKDPASQLAVNGPVPKGTAYVTGSASSPVKHELKFSYDGGKSWVTTPPLRTVRAPDGKASERPAPVEEITNVEWLAREPLKPGGEQAYRYRVRVTAAEQ